MLGPKTRLSLPRTISAGHSERKESQIKRGTGRECFGNADRRSLRQFSPSNLPPWTKIDVRFNKKPMETNRKLHVLPAGPVHAVCSVDPGIA